MAESIGLYSSQTFMSIVFIDAFADDFQPNILDDMIISLQPNHIITTNYDNLLDHYGYDVITSDRDLLKANSNHYLMKIELLL